MAFETIIAIAVFVLVLVFIWGIFKKLFKLLFYAGIIIFLLLAANMFFIYRDVADLRENFGISAKKVLLVDGDDVLTGLLLDGDIRSMANGQLEEFSLYLSNNNYEKILGTDYKLMIFDVDIIYDLDVEEIEFEERTITKDSAIATLKSDEKDANEKANLFGIILANDILSPENPLFFFSEYKKGNIVIYPETALFKTVKIIPVSFIKDAGKKMFEKTKETAESFVAEESENI